MLDKQDQYTRAITSQAVKNLSLSEARQRVDWLEHELRMKDELLQKIEIKAQANAQRALILEHQKEYY